MNILKVTFPQLSKQGLSMIDVAALLIIAGGIEHVHRYNLLSL